MDDEDSSIEETRQTPAPRAFDLLGYNLHTAGRLLSVQCVEKAGSSVCFGALFSLTSFPSLRAGPPPPLVLGGVVLSSLGSLI